ncbi:MAG TPA: dipeptidase [Candidatus Krumholzibacteriaceae bacterium]|nr:dipeptidase [Candidatus Krumholzibacteriaceae bacterium]
MDIINLHGEAVVVDTHCDTLKCLLPEFTRPRDSMGDDRSDLGMGVRSNLGHVDVPRLLEGGVDCQVFAVSSERSRTPAHPLRTALEMIGRFYRECESCGSLTPVTSHDEVLDAKRKGMVAGLLSIEGADVIEGRIEMLRVFHRLGVRMVGLVHSLRNQLADGVTDRRTGGGLSELGIQAVEELNRLGMIVDVSHINDEGFWDVLDLTKHPVIASHSNSRAVCSHPRNMTDEMIVALAENGGVMGMNFAPSFVHPEQATLQRVVDHIDHIVDLVGPDHVGLGSDLDGIPSTPVGLEDVTKMPRITEELVNREYSEVDIKKILGGNHLRLMKKVVG